MLCFVVIFGQCNAELRHLFICKVYARLVRSWSVFCECVLCSGVCFVFGCSLPVSDEKIVVTH